MGYSPWFDKISLSWYILQRTAPPPQTNIGRYCLDIRWLLFRLIRLTSPKINYIIILGSIVFYCATYTFFHLPNIKLDLLTIVCNVNWNSRVYLIYHLISLGFSIAYFDEIVPNFSTPNFSTSNMKKWPNFIVYLPADAVVVNYPWLHTVLWSHQCQDVESLPHLP